MRWGATGKLAPGLAAVAATATGMGMGLGVWSVGWECSQRYNIGRLSMVVGLVLNVEKVFFSSGCSDFLSHGFFFPSSSNQPPQKVRSDAATAAAVNTPAFTDFVYRKGSWAGPISPLCL